MAISSYFLPRHNRVQLLVQIGLVTALAVISLIAALTLGGEILIL
jgi:hypothetical protein